jgi:4-hydroxy-tetrahydrodipicolinate synthase
VLNIQAVFRWALTKQVLLQRGLIDHAHQRVAGPRLDAQDRADLDGFLGDLQDLLLRPSELALLRTEGEHGAA